MAKKKTEYTLKSGSMKVPVTFVDSDMLQEMYLDGDEDDGVTALGACIQIRTGFQLLISNEVKNPLKHGIVNHEIFELLNAQYDLGLSHQTITTLGEGLTQIEVDNKKVLQALK